MTTPLHERRGVRWLMQSPEWPKQLQRLDIPQMSGWLIDGHWEPGDKYDATAHDLLELAGVRALWNDDISVCVAEFASARFGVHWQAVMLTPRGDGYEPRQFSGPTSLDAILAAVEAVLVPEGWTP